MFFSISFEDKHLKNLKKHPDLFYRLVNKLSVFSSSSIDKLITCGKENGITKITSDSIYKQLKIDDALTVYKFRVSDKIRCYCHKNIASPNTLNLIYIDVNHTVK